MTKRGRQLRASHRLVPRLGKKKKTAKQIRTKNSKNEKVGSRPGYEQHLSTKRKGRPS